MNVKSAKVLEEVTIKSNPIAWKNLRDELSTGGELLTAKGIDRKGFYEITYNDPRLGLCRTQISPRRRRR